MCADRLLFILTAVAAIFVVFPSTAFAYLDPGTGSLLLQILAGALFGALFFLKLFWRRVVTFFRRGKVTRTDGEIPDEE